MKMFFSSSLDVVSLPSPVAATIAPSSWNADTIMYFCSGDVLAKTISVWVLRTCFSSLLLSFFKSVPVNTATSVSSGSTWDTGTPRFFAISSRVKLPFQIFIHYALQKIGYTFKHTALFKLEYLYYHQILFPHFWQSQQR